MFSSMWDYCPVCGILHDDGAHIKDPETGKYYFVCMDCGDKPDAEILQAIEEQRHKSGRNAEA